MEIAGKKAVIVGGASGFGRATGEAFLKPGEPRADGNGAATCKTSSG